MVKVVDSDGRKTSTIYVINHVNIFMSKKIVRSKANQLENATNFLNSGLRQPRSITITGHAQAASAVRDVPISSAVCFSSITKRQYLSQVIKCKCKESKLARSVVDARATDHKTNLIELSLKMHSKKIDCKTTEDQVEGIEWDLHA